MKKIFMIFILISICIYTKDFKKTFENLYVIEIYEIFSASNGRPISDITQFKKVGIIRVMKNKNEISELFVDEFPKTEKGKKVVMTLKEMTDIDFTKCRLQDINKLEGGLPLIVKRLNDYEYDDKIMKSALAIVSEEIFYSNSYKLKYPRMLSSQLEINDFFCPEYYNGD